jgi:hypothetical protein
LVISCRLSHHFDISKAENEETLNPTTSRNSYEKILEKNHRCNKNLTYKAEYLAISQIISEVCITVQVVLRKENGSFGLVLRGGSHEVPARVRPFTVIHIDKVMGHTALQ